MTKEKRHKRRDSPERESKVKIKQEKESPVRPHKTRRSRSRSNGNSSPQRTSRYWYITFFDYNLLLEQCSLDTTTVVKRKSTCIFFKRFRTRDRSSGRAGTSPTGRESRSPRNRRSRSPHRVKRVIMSATVSENGPLVISLVRWLLWIAKSLATLTH